MPVSEERIHDLRAKLIPRLVLEFTLVAGRPRPIDVAKIVQDIGIEVRTFRGLSTYDPTRISLLPFRFPGDFARAIWPAINHPIIEIDARMTGFSRQYYVAHELAHLVTGTGCSPTTSRDSLLETACSTFSERLLFCPLYLALIADYGFHVQGLLDITGIENGNLLSFASRLLPQPHLLMVFMRRSFPHPIHYIENNTLSTDQSIFGLPQGEPYGVLPKNKAPSFLRNGSVRATDEHQLLESLGRLWLDEEPVLLWAYHSLHSSKGRMMSGNMAIGQENVQVMYWYEPFQDRLGPIGNRKYRYSLVGIVPDRDGAIWQASRGNGYVFLPRTLLPAWLSEPGSGFKTLDRWLGEVVEVITDIDRYLGYEHKDEEARTRVLQC